MKIENYYRWIVDYAHLRKLLRAMADEEGMTYREFADMSRESHATYQVMVDTSSGTYNYDKNMLVGTLLTICTDFEIDPRTLLGVVRL